MKQVMRFLCVSGLLFLFCFGVRVDAREKGLLLYCPFEDSLESKGTLRPECEAAGGVKDEPDAYSGWWLERKERQVAQTALLKQSNETIQTLTKFEAVLERVVNNR